MINFDPVDFLFELDDGGMGGYFLSECAIVEIFFPEILQSLVNLNDVFLFPEVVIFVVDDKVALDLVEFLVDFEGAVDDFLNYFSAEFHFVDYLH